MYKIKIEIEIPDNYQKYFKYLELNFNLKRKRYLEDIVNTEIKSRNEDLKLF